MKWNLPETPRRRVLLFGGALITGLALWSATGSFSMFTGVLPHATAEALPLEGGPMQSIYEIPVREIKGGATTLEKYRGKGLVVLGFPANNFGGQEPGTEAEIVEFCTMRYQVSFPMFAKVSAKGNDIHPLYRYLTAKETNPGFDGPISWNFNKFLIDRSGKTIARFESSDAPGSARVVEAIEAALR